MGEIGRHTFRLDREARRPVLMKWVEKLPVGAVVEFRDATRTEEQNDKMWPMLREVARQVARNGVHYNEEAWKFAFLKALGKEVKLVPDIEGNGVTPYLDGSSKLTVKEFSDLIEMIYAFGAENGVEFKE